jgi:hypothetical protein
MTLSILCVTDGKPHAEHFLCEMSDLSFRLHCEFIVGLDNFENMRTLDAIHWIGHKIIHLPPHEVKLQECVLDEAIKACSGDYILRLDDDEKVSRSLEMWLMNKDYESGNLFSFPRVYMYPDTKHILCNEGMFPDLQTRLGRKELMFGVNSIHAGNPNGCGAIINKAIEHHKLIIKTLDERQEIKQRYDAIRPGAGSSRGYAMFNTPEEVFEQLEVREYSDGNYE